VNVLPEADGGVFKCSYPKAFNDPYELFLSLDLNETPELIAYYAEVIGELPQLPTTCFSRSPAVLPMWAHYAQNLEGFVVEVDEARLASRYPESGFGDVDYRESPDPRLNSALAHAYTTCKPRHTFLLRRWVFSAAYYTKAKCWAYEQERRMVAGEAEIRTEGDLLLLDVPREAISGIVCGPRASEQTRKNLLDRSSRLGCRFLDMKIGRTSATPYFEDTAGRAWLFAEDGWIGADTRCSQCGEPVSSEETLCSLCRVDDAHLSEAAKRNPYRILHRHGMLPDYIRDMDRLASGDT
jgi:hypothetical protein